MGRVQAVKEEKVGKYSGVEVAAERRTPKEADLLFQSHTVASCIDVKPNVTSTSLHGSI